MKARNSSASAFSSLWYAEWDAAIGENDWRIGEGKQVCRVQLLRPEGGVYAVHIKPGDSHWGFATGIFACPDAACVLIALDGYAVLLDVTTGKRAGFEAIGEISNIVTRDDYIFLFAWRGMATIRSLASFDVKETAFYPCQNFQPGPSGADVATVLLDRPPDFDIPVQIDMRRCEVMR